MDLLDKLAHYFSCLYSELYEVWLVRHSANWVAVRAMVRAISTDSSVFLSEFQILFTYSYNGKVYSGKVMRATLFGGRRLHEQIVAGNTYAAYVDPEHPERAYLPSETRWFEPVIVGLIALSMLTLIVWSFVRHFLLHMGE